MREWLHFLAFQSKTERRLIQAVRRWGRSLRKVIVPQVKYIDFSDAPDLWDDIEPILDDAFHDIPKHFSLEVDFSLYDARVSARLKMHQRRIKWVTEETWRQIRDALQRAIEKGDDVRQAVEDVLRDIETWRAERIARTESMGAINGGYFDGLVSAGFEKKMWFAALDERTRETHANAHGQVKPLGEPFEVGSALLQFPADPACNIPEEVINCRCCMLPAD